MWFVNHCFENRILRVPRTWASVLLQNRFSKQFRSGAFLAEGRAVKVERSRARGHVASNPLTARPGAIPCARGNCFESIAQCAIGLARIPAPRTKRLFLSAQISFRNPGRF